MMRAKKMDRAHIHCLLLIFVIILTEDFCQGGHSDTRPFLDRVRTYYGILNRRQQYRVHCLINKYRAGQQGETGRVSWLTIAAQIADVFCQACNSMVNAPESEDCRLRFCAAN